MQKLKDLYSYKEDIKTGSIDMFTGDFIPAWVKPSGAMPRTRAPTPRVPSGILQDGYNAPPAPANREEARLSEIGKKKVSRLVAAEGQDNVGMVDW